MEGLYSFDLVLLLLCGGAFFKAAMIDDAPPLLWAGLSVGLYFLTWRVLYWGIFPNLACQFGLFIALALVGAAVDSANRRQTQDKAEDS